MNDVLASEVDVLPTIAAFTSTPHLNSTMGRDLLDQSFDGHRVVFTTDAHGKIRSNGVLSRDFYFTMTSDGSQRSLHHLAADDPSINVADANPEIASEMEAMCCAFYETARYLSHFNSPDKLTAQP